MPMKGPVNPAHPGPWLELVGNGPVGNRECRSNFEFAMPGGDQRAVCGPRRSSFPARSQKGTGRSVVMGGGGHADDSGREETDSCTDTLQSED